MWKNGLLLILAVCVNNVLLIGQIKKQFTVDSSSKFEKLAFNMYASSGSCQIRPTHHTKLVTIYCKSEDSNYNPLFATSYGNKMKVVNLKLGDNDKEGISKTISNKIFSSSYTEIENKCNIYLSQDKPIILDLKYGVGDAFADLSGLAVEQLKISTGSADVTIGYQQGKANLIQMDTFSIKVDLGSVTAKRLSLSRASHVIANVGFGDLTLDFSDPSLINTTVHASVGAGTLNIQISESNTPAIIHINNSLLCRVKFNKKFKEIRKNVFVNKSYAEDASNLITFNVDVAMGNIIFN